MPGPWSKNTYVREDQILPHLAAVAILLAGEQTRGGNVQVAVPAQTAELIDQLGASGTVLTYDPDTRTIRASGCASFVITASQNH